MSIFKNSILLAGMATVMAACGTYQDGRFFADQITLSNATGNDITVIGQGKKEVLPPQTKLAIGLSTQFIYQGHLFTISWPAPDASKPIGKVLNRAELDITTLALLAQVHEHSNGLDELVLNNNTYYPAELTDLDGQPGQPAITLNADEQFAKNAALLVNKAAAKTPIWGNLALAILGEQYTISYPRRTLVAGMAQTLDFRSSTIALNTLIEVKKYGITITAKPLGAKALAHLSLK